LGETGLGFFGNRSAAATTRRAGNEGVGEHVRTKSQPANLAGEIADLWIRTDEENFFLPPNRLFRQNKPCRKRRPDRLT
jgi:hypothetical protein